MELLKNKKIRVLFIIGTVLIVVVLLAAAKKEKDKICIISNNNVDYFDDAKKGEIVELMDNLNFRVYLKNISDCKNNTLEFWIDKITELKDNNLFSNKLYSIVINSSYSELDDYEKMFLDYYIREPKFYYYDDYYFEHNTIDLSKIDEAYIVEFDIRDLLGKKELILKEKSNEENKFNYISIIVYETKDGIKCITEQEIIR